MDNMDEGEGKRILESEKYWNTLHLCMKII
jgi:hypothetical protein